MPSKPENEPPKMVKEEPKPRKQAPKRSSEKEDEEYERRFTGVSRMAAYQKGVKLGEGTFGSV